MPGHTLQHQVAPCKNVHSAIKNIQFGVDGCNTVQLGNYKPFIFLSYLVEHQIGKKYNLNHYIISSLEPHRYTLITWYTQYYDLENSKTIVFDIYCSYWSVHGCVGKNTWWVISDSFSPYNITTQLCMERDRPLKLHLLWGRKHVFLTTIYHKPDCKNTFAVQAGRRIFSLQNTFMP